MEDNKYTSNTIQTLSYFDHIRQYPGMYIGSKDSHGLHHCAKEIISNSIDEYLNGACNKIEITLTKDGGFKVKDNGRGIPHGKHESGCSTLQACFGIANTGGKFNNATGDTGYNTSGGEHGTGCKAVNALSKKLIASTARDGTKEIVEFSKGNFVSYKEEDSTEQGVEVLFYPDKEIFETIEFDDKLIKQMIQEFSYLCTGLSFQYKNDKTKETKTFYSEKGLYDYVSYLNGGKDFLFEPWYFSLKDGTFQLEAIIGYTDSYNNITKLYTNNIPQDKGTHLTGFRTAITQSFNNFARDLKILKEKDENFNGNDFLEGQIVILNFKMIDPVFKGQNKEELSSSEGRLYCQALTTQGLQEIYNFHQSDVKVVLSKAAEARKAREAAKKAKDAIRGQAQKREKALKFATKLADCYSKERDKCEIYITEGK